MAYFLPAYNKTARNEGGYSNHPDDTGGETWKGIARNYHPKWEGWTIIDLFKSNPKFIQLISNNNNLQLLVYRFYKIEFWDKLRGDEIINQEEANIIYDMAVNAGISPAIKMAQRSLAIKETGTMDDHTLNLLNSKR